MTIDPIAEDIYEKLVEGYTDEERHIFARGVLVGTKNIVDKITAILGNSELTDQEVVDIIGSNVAVISIALMMSGVQ